MPIPKYVIKKAIQGGYPKSNVNLDGSSRIGKPFELDPKFFQALGRALGWSETECWHAPEVEHNFECKEWMQRAHHYFDLVLTGGDVEKFWEDLINSHS